MWLSYKIWTLYRLIRHKQKTPPRQAKYILSTEILTMCVGWVVPGVIYMIVYKLSI